MNTEQERGSLSVVGIGPGAVDQMTGEAFSAIEESDVIAGYQVYVDLVKEQFPGKEFLSTPMRREEERCALALREAAKGRKVALICSGDAGVYGLAGLVLEMAAEYPEVEIRVVPGVTAALSPERPDDPLGDHRKTSQDGGGRRFRHRSLQSFQQKAGGLSSARLRHPAGDAAVGAGLRHSAEHRP